MLSPCLPCYRLFNDRSAALPLGSILSRCDDYHIDM